MEKPEEAAVGTDEIDPGSLVIGPADDGDAKPRSCVDDDAELGRTEEAMGDDCGETDGAGCGDDGVDDCGVWTSGCVAGGAVVGEVDGGAGGGASPTMVSLTAV